MLQILIIISPLFFIIFASALVQRLTHVGDTWHHVLNSFAFNIGLPALIFSTLIHASFSFRDEAGLIVINSLFILISLGLAIAIGKLFRLRQQQFLTLFICFCFGNIAYLGIPVLSHVAGSSILPRVSLIIAIHLFWIFSVAIAYLDFSKQKNKRHIAKNIFKNLYKNPLLMSVFVGLLISIFSIPVPTFIQSSFTMLSASVTPIVLIVIGLFIGSSHIGNIREWIPVFVFSIITLFILPALVYVFLLWTSIPPRLYFSTIIEAAMPLAITPFALADIYQLDKTFIARSIVLSTTLSIISLPFWIFIIG